MKKKFLIHKKEKKVIELQCDENKKEPERKNGDAFSLIILKNRLIQDLHKMDRLFESHLIER